MSRLPRVSRRASIRSRRGSLPRLRRITIRLDAMRIPRGARCRSVASTFPQCIIFVATRAFIACVRIRLVDGGTNQGQFRARIIRSISRIRQCIRRARITCAHNDSCSNFDQDDDTSLHVDSQFISPDIAGAADGARITWRCRDLQASTGRVDRPDARSTNKKACTVRSRRHGRQNSEECRGAASSKGQSII